MTHKTHRFIEANKQSPVVYGSVIGGGREGCFYRLADDRTFTLSAAECKAIGVPRWAFEKAA